MRWRIAASIAVMGIAGIPAVSDAAQPRAAPSLHVAVRPATGSRRTHFVISFRAAETTGRVGFTQRNYRVTATDTRRGRCQSSATSQASPSRSGAEVRVVLAPRGSRGWCAGTFRGAVWSVIRSPCPPRELCPAILTAPRLVGKFTFRVKHG